MRRTLLLADDSPTIQRVIELTFADREFDVVCVSDGQAAVDRIAADPPDIVLADVEMPERTGYEVSAFVKDSADLAHIPVVLLTGAFEPIDEARAQGARCDGVLAKPFEPQAVVDQVATLVAKADRRLPAEASPPPAAFRPPAADDAPSEPVARTAEPDAASVAGDAHRIETTPPGGEAEPKAESVDEYLDRLDAAFATLGAATAQERGADEGAGSSGAVAEAPEQETELDALALAPTGPPDQRTEPGTLTPEPVEAPEQETVERWTSVAEPEAPIPLVDLSSPAAADAEADARGEAVASPEASTPAPGAVPLADAFESLLAEEQGEPRPPAPARAAVTSGPGAASALDVEILDRLVAEVVERLGDRLPAGRSEPAPMSDDALDELARRVAERISRQTVRETVTEVVLTVADRLVREEIERLKAEASSP